MLCEWCREREGVAIDPLGFCPDCRGLWDTTKVLKREAFGKPYSHPVVVAWLAADRKLKAACRPFGDLDAGLAPAGVGPASDG